MRYKILLGGGGKGVYNQPKVYLLTKCQKSYNIEEVKNLIIKSIKHKFHVNCMFFVITRLPSWTPSWISQHYQCWQSGRSPVLQIQFSKEKHFEWQFQVRYSRLSHCHLGRQQKPQWWQNSSKAMSNIQGSAKKGCVRRYISKLQVFRCFVRPFTRKVLMATIAHILAYPIKSPPLWACNHYHYQR